MLIISSPEPLYKQKLEPSPALRDFAWLNVFDAAQLCDATGDAITTAAGYKKYLPAYTKK